MKKSAFTAEGRIYQQHLEKFAKSAGLTTRALAEKLGAFQNQVWRALRGDRRVDLVEFIWWCDACGADPLEEFGLLLRQIKRLARRTPAASRRAK